MDHDAAFVAQAALASIPMNASIIFMALAYVRVAQHAGTAVSMAVALLVWFFLAVPHPRVRLEFDRRTCAECRCLRGLPAAGAALSRRQDAADHAALVRHPAARRAGRNARRHRRHDVEHRRPDGNGHHRAVPRRVHQPDPDPAPTHRRARHAAVLANGLWGLLFGSGSACSPCTSARRISARRPGLSLGLAICVTWNLGLWAWGRRAGPDSSLLEDPQRDEAIQGAASRIASSASPTRNDEAASSSRRLGLQRIERVERLAR